MRQAEKSVPEPGKSVSVWWELPCSGDSFASRGKLLVEGTCQKYTPVKKFALKFIQYCESSEPHSECIYAHYMYKYSRFFRLIAK